jgi:hypothetical protein
MRNFVKDNAGFLAEAAFVLAMDLPPKEERREIDRVLREAVYPDPRTVRAVRRSMVNARWRRYTVTMGGWA